MTTADTALRATLPIPPTELIGRDRELVDLCEQIGSGRIRLATLTGPGGIGKSRLALAAALRLQPSFPDGIVFVPLAALRDATLVVGAIAQALGAGSRAGADPSETVAQTLTGKRVLVLLDNFEQVTEAAPQLVWLLSLSNEFAIIVTSRVRVHVRGEHEFIVGPLATSAPDRHAPLDVPAVRLFENRAKEVAPSFHVDGSNDAVVSEICRRLEGIPLAIELAAARSKVFPPQALLTRLDRRLPLLTGGPRDLPDRLQTMRNAIAWSYDLLDPDEQRLFRTLCIFSGGFNIAMAANVLADPAAETSRDTSPFALEDALTSLADSSLLQVTVVEDEPRFSMLETLREFGLDELRASGAFDAVARRHAGFFISYAEAAMPRLSGADRSSWLARLDRDQPNLRTALEWLCDRGEAADAVRLAGALWQFWWWRSHLEEGRMWLERVLALPAASESGEAYARVLTGLGSIEETLGDVEKAERFHDQAARAWEALGDRRGLALSLLFRWLVAFNADDQERMTTLCGESLRLFRETGDSWGVAMSLMEQGVMAMRANRNDDGEEVLLAAIETFRSNGDAWGVAISQGALGNMRTAQRRFAEAETDIKASLSALIQLNDLWGVATILPAVARWAADQGRWETVALVGGALTEMHRTLGMPLRVPFRETYERNAERALAALGAEQSQALAAKGSQMSLAEVVTTAFAEPAPSAGGTAQRTTGLDALTIPLSPREREVIRLVPRMSAREIGEELFIAESTVRTHIDHILNKLGTKNQKELIAFIYEHGIV